MSNLPQVAARVKQIQDRVTHAFDLQRQGIAGKTLGDFISDLIVYGILRQHAMGREPDGSMLPPLSPAYKLWKTLHHKNPALLHKDDQMMQFRQLKGMLILHADEMRLFYGVSNFEMQKAEWTQEGQLNARGWRRAAVLGRTPSWRGFARGLWHRPPRDFFDINKWSWDRIDDYMDAELDTEIMGLGARRI